jgi:predicted regulator of Ras-like GTPase activity (Roadblock/LC7/MglB family)
MNSTNIVLHETEYLRLKSILAKMQRELRAELVLLINHSGQQIACEGPARDVDLTALSSLAAANLAATDGLARLVGEPQFSILYHQGKHRSIYISDLAQKLSLVVMFDETVAPGMVRWKVKRGTASLQEVFSDFLKKVERQTAYGGSQTYFSDEEIEKLLSINIPKSTTD